MTQPDDPAAAPICTRCGQHSSNHHICQIINGDKEVLDLYEDCASDWKKNSAIPFADPRGTSCYYCGAAASSGGMNQEWEKKVRGQDFHFTCVTCLENYSRLFLDWINRMPTDIPPEDQMVRISEAIGIIDEEVRATATRSNSKKQAEQGGDGDAEDV
jgi:hypothetical protein